MDELLSITVLYGSLVVAATLVIGGNTICKASI